MDPTFEPDVDAVDDDDDPCVDDVECTAIVFDDFCFIQEKWFEFFFVFVDSFLLGETKQKKKKFRRMLYGRQSEPKKNETTNNENRLTFESQSIDNFLVQKIRDNHQTTTTATTKHITFVCVCV